MQQAYEKNVINLGNIQDLLSPACNFKSQNSILGFVENTICPTSPLWGTNEVSAKKIIINIIQI